jgi:ATP-dependent Clp protease ATP-binding subunit ClpC
MARIDESAEAIAADLGHTYVGTEHMLLALAADGDGVAGRVLADLGVAEEVRARLREIMASPGYRTGSSQVVDESGNLLGHVRGDEQGNLVIEG